VRDKRRRMRREREREREDRERAFRESQRRLPACSYCGRRPGQVATPDFARVVFHGPEAGPELEGMPVLIESGPHKGEPVLTRPYAGGHGCKYCIHGLDGEYAREGDVHTIRIMPAPSREEIAREREREAREAREKARKPRS
jgi:hypothetical protein